MTELLDLAKHSDDRLDQAFAEATADPARHGELVDTLTFLTGHGKAGQAELLAWTWLSDVRQNRSPAEALELARKMLAACPESGQLRVDMAEAYGAAFPDRADAGDWLAASGLTGGRVSPQRACRALDLALTLQPGGLLIDRTSARSPNLHEHRVVEVVGLDAKGGQIAIRPIGGGAERQVELLRLGDDYARAADDDFRVLARRDPARLRQALDDNSLGVLIAMLQAGGGQMDADQLKDNLSPSVMTPGDYAKWWSRARTAARKSPNIRIEGRTPAVLIYDLVGTSAEQETLAVLARTWEPPARMAVVESYLRGKAADKQPADPAFLAGVAKLSSKWLAAPDIGLADVLVARRLADLGVPIPPLDAGGALTMLAARPDVVDQLVQLQDTTLWSLALSLLPQARPVAPAGPGPDDWQAIYLQLLPRAPLECCDAIARALIEAGQAGRVNAEIIAIVESPLDAIDGLCWLWGGPAVADQLDLPRSKELLDQLLWLAKQADPLAKSNQKLAREIRGKVRSALSARSFGRFRGHVESLDPVIAPMLRRQIRRADGLGVTIPEQMLAILDEAYPPPVETRSATPPWERDDLIYVSAATLAAKEKELDQITNVQMPANSRAIAAAASHGDLSENSEYKFALEERDFLKARVARIQQELVQALVITPHEVPGDHVSIYSHVVLAPTDGGPQVALQIVSPWDGDVAGLRFNYRAPFSRLLLGKRPGETVRLAIGESPEQEFRIESTRPPAA